MSGNRKWVAIGLGGLLVAVCGSALAGAPSLFTPAPLVLRDAEQDTAFVALQENPSAHSIVLMQVDSRIVSENSESIGLSFDIGGPFELTAHRLNSYRTSDGMTVWRGVIGDASFGARPKADPAEIADDPLNSVMLVRNGNRITGNFRVFGQLYQIRPLHDARHAIVEVDEARMPPDHPDAAYRKLLEAAVQRDSAADAQPVPLAASTIRVMVNYTQAVKAAVGDVTGLITLAVAETNQGYANSGVDITMQLATSAQVSYTETGNFTTDLSRYRGTSDGFMDSIHAARNSSTADVAVLLVTNTAYCGLASAIGASAATAFVEVYWDCATGYYSFGHEIGHLQSARHDPANDPTNTPYAYGHGYQYAAGGWRTIMAYACSSGCTRVNYWSNPGNTYLGHAMGTTTRSDNHRVLNNTRATIAAFR
jgi:peptidyl-Asp metalloendopeptidase